MKKQQIPLKNSLILLLTATIWGIAFVAQSEGGEAVGPLTFNATRNIIGSLVLIPVILLLNKINPQSNSADFTESDRQPMASSGSNPFSRNKTLIAGGIICGICLCLASNFQQFGIQYTSVGKAGFLTACYIIIVPILGLFMKKKCSPFIWVAVVMALIGLYLLCITDGFSIGKGDFLVLICAFLFSLHILVIDYFSPKTDGVKMSCIQFLVCGILTAIPAIILEHQSFFILGRYSLCRRYACGGATHPPCPAVGQKYKLNPTVASLILSLESCISVLAGWIILGQKLSTREIIGCVVMFGAIVLAQLPQKETASEK